MRIHTQRFLLIGALTLVCEAALAEMVPVTWDQQGEFAKSVAVKPGKFVELCEKLPAGAKVTWGFKADAALNFNLHFHEGKDVRYPVKQDQVAQAQGVFDAQVAQDYCWMWVNKGASPVTLALQLKRN
ncbi:MAG: hypothetical protein H7Z15_12305 [Rhizobacter sp.]|nr:hypothetical protein [Rhizobacter sp.]